MNCICSAYVEAMVRFGPNDTSLRDQSGQTIIVKLRHKLESLSGSLGTGSLSGGNVERTVRSVLLPVCGVCAATAISGCICPEGTGEDVESDH